MIVSFRSKALRRFYEIGDRKGLRPDLANRIHVLLSILDVAKSVEAMNVVGFRLHPLKGELKGFWSVAVRANWRIIFRFEDGKAYDVDLIDYH